MKSVSDCVVFITTMDEGNLTKSAERSEFLIQYPDIKLQLMMTDTIVDMGL